MLRTLADRVQDAAEEMGWLDALNTRKPDFGNAN